MASTGVGSAQSRMVPAASVDTMRSGPSQVTEVTGWASGSVADSARVAMFHTSTLASEVPAARLCPSGLNATALTQFVAPVKVPSGTALPDCPAARAAPSRHNHTFLSRLDAARSRPSGLNATPETCMAGPVSGIPANRTG